MAQHTLGEDSRPAVVAGEVTRLGVETVGHDQRERVLRAARRRLQPLAECASNTWACYGVPWFGWSCWRAMPSVSRRRLDGRESRSPCWSPTASRPGVPLCRRPRQGANPRRACPQPSDAARPAGAGRHDRPQRLDEDRAEPSLVARGPGGRSSDRWSSRQLDHAVADSPSALCQALSLAACPVALWRGDTPAAERWIARLEEEYTNHAMKGGWSPAAAGLPWRRVLEAQARPPNRVGRRS